VFELRPPHRGIGDERVRPNLGRRPARSQSLASETSVRLLVLSYRIAQSRPPGRRRVALDSGLATEQVEANLVLQVVLVQQCGFDDPQVALGRAFDDLGALEEDVVLEHHRPHPDLFREFEKVVASFRALEMIERRHKAGFATEPLFLDNDRESEIDRQVEPA